MYIVNIYYFMIHTHVCFTQTLILRSASWPLPSNFEDFVPKLVQFLMPLLRFIRMCDSDGEYLSLVYSRIEAIRLNFQDNVDSISSMPGVAEEILALFEQESK